MGRAYDSALIRRLWHYVRPYKSLLLGSLGLLVAGSAAQLVQPYIVKVAIDDYILQGRVDGLGRIGLLFLVAITVEFLLRWAQLYLLERTGQNVVFDLRHEVFSHLQRLPSSYFQMSARRDG